MFQKIQRVSQIARVLLKHGLGWAVQELELKWHIPLITRLFVTMKQPKDLPVRLRKAMEELGGAYIKLGQMLAIRPDLIPQEYCDEFSKLLDEVPPEDISTVTKTIEKEFKKPIKEVFASIDPKPIGSASVAQVHLARLKNGKRVVVKVQRPHIKEQFSADIAIMHYLAQKLESKLSGRIGSPKLIVQEFEQYTKNELNFLTEARNINQFRKIHKKQAKIKIPEIYMPYTSEHVLTMEYLEGKKLSELNKYAVSVSRKALSKDIIDLALYQIFRAGVFHADLHPGNVLLMHGNKLGLLDFGIVGKVDPDARRKGLELYVAIIKRDITAIKNTLLSYGTPSAETDLEEFHNDVIRTVSKWYGESLAQARVTRLLQNLFVCCAQNNIQLPRDIVLLGKALVTVEATAKYINPDFNFVTYSKPKIASLLEKEGIAKTRFERILQRARSIKDIMAILPRETLGVIEKLKTGKLTVGLRDTQFRHVGFDIELSSNRIAYAMLASALILASALVWDFGPKINGYPLASIAGITLAVIFMFPLLVSIMREGKTPHDIHAEQAKRW